MWKLFDIGFSYKHCNFSRVYLLVKMASKTMTRSIFVLSDQRKCMGELEFSKKQQRTAVHFRFTV